MCAGAATGIHKVAYEARVLLEDVLFVTEPTRPAAPTARPATGQYSHVVQRGDADRFRRTARLGLLATRRAVTRHCAGCEIPRTTRRFALSTIFEFYRRFRLTRPAVTHIF